MTRRLLPVLVATLLAASHSRAADKPNTLTPQEIADGWLLLFDGETTFGWKTHGDVKIQDGTLVLVGNKGEATAIPTTRFGAYELRIETAGGEGEIGFATQNAASHIRLDNHPAQITITVQLNDGKSGPQVDTRTEAINGVVRTVSRVMMDALTAPQLRVPNSKSLRIKTVKLRPLGTKPLFNGKDLSGWKVFQDPKRTATKFTVTPAGELHAQNGPGDLQTEKAYDNFSLQLECKTNGNALNSGIFFRCLPGQYQQGYEAQIQNAYRDNDRTKPADFGTGAIYRRVPARKVVSNDNEWFTLTLVADGPHLSTWVNGYQTVDWTDDRQPNDNARQGRKLGKGHLSIQGHDKTTDLLFRNIRIVELPK